MAITKPGAVSEKVEQGNMAPVREPMSGKPDMQTPKDAGMADKASYGRMGSKS